MEDRNVPGRNVSVVAPENAQVHFEGSDIHVRGVFAVAIGVVLTGMLIVAAGAWWLTMLHRYAVHHDAPLLPLAAHGRPLPPEPRLQQAPQDDMAKLRAAEDRQLASYGWIDRPKGIVRIPIKEAMRIVAQRGIPVQKSDPKLFFQPRAGDPLTGFEGKAEGGPQ